MGESFLSRKVTDMSLRPRSTPFARLLAIHFENRGIMYVVGSLVAKFVRLFLVRFFAKRWISTKNLDLFYFCLSLEK
jgi:hypothetical protein